MPPPVSGPSAEAFASAVSRFSRFRGQTVVVKLGGSAMEGPAGTRACLQSVAALNLLGLHVILIHGGGKPIDRAMSGAGLTPKKVAGRRYTDDATLAIVVRVLKDEINAGLAAELQGLGGACARVSTALRGDRLQLPGPDNTVVDLGRVGNVTHVDTVALAELLRASQVPLLPSLALAPDGGWLNVNADTAASAVAGAMRAERAVFLTDTPGVLRDRHDPTSRLARLTEAECRSLIAAGVIDGGMVPKVEACFEALAAGAGSALILDGRVPYSLLDVFLNDSLSGTEITR